MASRFPAANLYPLPVALLPPLEEFLRHWGNGTLLLSSQADYGLEPGEWFGLLTAESLQALVFAVPGSGERCRVGLTFDIGAIATFMQSLGYVPPSNSLETVRQPAAIAAAGDFAAALTSTLVTLASNQSQKAEDALSHQQERSLLLTQVTNKIRQSLDLAAILQTTVTEVREFLGADRLLIYQFQGEAEAAPEPLAPLPSSARTQDGGYIAYEARSDDALPSVLNYTEAHCFTRRSTRFNPHREGRPLGVDDVAATYQKFPCLLEFLQENQVRSKLVAPILVNGEVWGLLIAHQCYTLRQWQSWELEFLRHIAEYLAVAIQQAQLYQQLQQQTQNLEHCVVERTHDLRDALAAAKSASRAKSEFLAIMSHELRTPLTCIIGMSATLLRWSFGDLSPRQQDYLTTIHRSGEHLLSLINDILEMSKIESGRMVLAVSEFSLGNLVRQSLEQFRTLATQRGVQLQLDIRLSQEADSFTADSQRVRQILNNLLSNAIKFTASGGQVTVRVRREQNYAVLVVEDTGIGIPAAQQPLLFEKFQQLENTRQRQYQGTGLGLALTQQLTQLHGGTIQVKSEVGVGSVFTVRLPLQRLTEARLEPNTTPEPIARRIVLVEDQEDSAGLICDMLTAAEYQVIWIVEASQVSSQIELLQPAAVIVNFHLKHIAGEELIASLRPHNHSLAPRVLALVSNDADSVIHAQAAGAEEVLVKPINPETLLAAVNRLMAEPAP